jgi:uncharacterized membrane protein YeaQ/YmgE (transglycosylase-associated protein family)
MIVTEQGLVGGLFLGVIGAKRTTVGLHQIGHAAVTGINLSRMLVSAADAILMLVPYHAFGAPQTSDENG